MYTWYTYIHPYTYTIRAIPIPTHSIPHTPTSLSSPLSSDPTIVTCKTLYVYVYLYTSSLFLEIAIIDKSSFCADHGQHGGIPLEPIDIIWWALAGSAAIIIVGTAVSVTAAVAYGALRGGRQRARRS